MEQSLAHGTDLRVGEAAVGLPGVVSDAQLLSVRSRDALEAEQAEYLRRIREGSSRKVLVPRAESRLDLRLPSDSDYVTLSVPKPGLRPNP
jgi:hypothetical protein